MILTKGNFQLCLSSAGDLALTWVIVRHAKEISTADWSFAWTSFDCICLNKKMYFRKCKMYMLRIQIVVIPAVYNVNFTWVIAHHRKEIGIADLSFTWKLHCRKSQQSFIPCARICNSLMFIFVSCPLHIFVFL